MDKRAHLRYNESFEHFQGQHAIDKGHMQAAPKENLPGQWTEGIDWPGPEYVTARTTGPKSIQLQWRMIDHETWGNRFFYILSFRNATNHLDEPWKV